MPGYSKPSESRIAPAKSLSIHWFRRPLRTTSRKSIYGIRPTCSLHRSELETSRSSPPVHGFLFLRSPSVDVSSTESKRRASSVVESDKREEKDGKRRFNNRER